METAQEYIAQNKKFFSRKNIIILVLVLILAIAFVLAYLFWFSRFTPKGLINEIELKVFQTEDFSSNLAREIRNNKNIKIVSSKEQEVNILSQAFYQVKTDNGTINYVPKYTNTIRMESVGNHEFSGEDYKTGVVRNYSWREETSLICFNKVTLRTEENVDWRKEFDKIEFFYKVTPIGLKGETAWERFKNVATRKDLAKVFLSAPETEDSFYKAFVVILVNERCNMAKN
ncbi:hypothetical protein ACFL1Q_00250 [Patescibacteria group bacterium]